MITEQPTQKKPAPLLFLLWVAILLSGCGGASGDDSTRISLIIQPASATLHPQETQFFSVTIEGTPEEGTADLQITWHLEEGSRAGAINSFGLYTASSIPGTYHVVATSKADVDLTASATVTVLPAVEERSDTPGSLDLTFGNGGKITTSLGLGSDAANGIVLQQDGKMIVAGYTFNGTNNDFLLLRYNGDGRLDRAFGNRGKVLIDFGSDDAANAVVVDSSGRILVAGYTYNGRNYDFALARYDPITRELDSSFGTDGKIVTPIGSGNDFAAALTVRSDNSILVAGNTYNGTDFDYAVVVYDHIGRLHSGFGNGGKVTTSFGVGNDFVFSVGLLPSDGVIVAGDSFNGTDFDFAMARYDHRGALVSTFGAGGKVISPIGRSHEAIRALSIKNDKITVAGFVYNATDADMALARYNLNGGFDTTFGADGVVMAPIGSGDDLILSLRIQSDDKLLTAGTAFNGIDSDFVIARYHGDGSLDSTFGNAGRAITDYGGNDTARAVAIQADGKVVAAGESVIGRNRDIALGRYDTAGGLDPTFNATGKQTFNFEQANASAQSLALQGDGKMIAAGDVFNGESYALTLIRYDIDGDIDLSFGEDGKVETFFDGGTGGEVVVQPDGNILAGGTLYQNGDNDFGLALYDSNGSFQEFFSVGFGPNGANEDDLKAMIIQPDGKILAAGVTLSGSNYDFALARFDTDGNLDLSFGVLGKVVTPMAQGNDIVNAMALQSDGKILLAGYSTNVVGNQFILARYNSNGTLDTSFGAGGKVISGDNAVATAILVQTDGKIVAGGYTFTNGNFDFTLVRYNTDGSLDSSFGNEGKVITDLDAGSDGIYALSHQSDGKIVAAGFSNVTNDDFAIARYQTDGMLDASFGQNGRKIIRIGQSIDFANAVAIQTDGKIIAAGGFLNGAHYEFALVRLWP